jgi:hypothetical protein
MLKLSKIIASRCGTRIIVFVRLYNHLILIIDKFAFFGIVPWISGRRLLCLLFSNAFLFLWFLLVRKIILHWWLRVIELFELKLTARAMRATTSRQSKMHISTFGNLPHSLISEICEWQYV